MAEDGSPNFDVKSTAATVGKGPDKDEEAAKAMFDFMGGPPKLEVIQEGTPGAASPQNSAAPTPEAPGPAEAVPTVITKAGENPLVMEDDASPPEPKMVKVDAPPAPTRSRRSSMKCGR